MSGEICNEVSAFDLRYILHLTFSLLILVNPGSNAKWEDKTKSWPTPQGKRSRRDANLLGNQKHFGLLSGFERAVTGVELCRDNVSCCIKKNIIQARAMKEKWPNAGAASKMVVVLVVIKVVMMVAVVPAVLVVTQRDGGDCCGCDGDGRIIGCHDGGGDHRRPGDDDADDCLGMTVSIMMELMTLFPMLVVGRDGTKMGFRKR